MVIGRKSVAVSLRKASGCPVKAMPDAFSLSYIISHWSFSCNKNVFFIQPNKINFLLNCTVYDIILNKKGVDSMPRPPKEGEYQHFKFGTDICKGMEKACRELKMKKTSFVERAIIEYIERMNGIICKDERIYPLVSFKEYIKDSEAKESNQKLDKSSVYA